VILIAAAGTSFAGSNPPFTVQTVLYRGSAYGVYAHLGDTVVAGPTASAALQQPCGTNQNNLLVTGTSAGVNLPPLVVAGVTNTSASTSILPTMASQTISDVLSLNLLAGAVTADEMKSVSTTSLDANGFHVSSAGTNFTNLRILGLPYNGQPAPNTHVDLPLLGYVVLNEQTSFLNNNEADLTVNMVHIVITVDNLLGIPVGTELVISSASSGMVRAFAPAVITGLAYGTQVILAGGIVSSSPTAPVNLPCYGTAGQTITNSLASVNLAGILSSGTVTNTGKSALLFPYSTGTMTTHVEGLNLLSGLVGVSALSGRVDGTIAGTGGVFKTATGTFVGLTVAGHPEIGDLVPYNTSVDILGLGTLYLKRVLRHDHNPSNIEIRMVELVVNQTNSYGLPIGADVIVGSALLGIVPASEP
jgi:hypothetical protein